MVVLQLVLNKNLYSKDPQSSELGQRITEHSIEMIHQLGFEGFTFKKLSDRIDCTEKLPCTDTLKISTDF